MIVNQETKVTTEIVGVNIYLNVEEAKLLQYILRKHHDNFVNDKCKIKNTVSYMVQANILSVYLSSQIASKIMGV